MKGLIVHSSQILYFLEIKITSRGNENRRMKRKRKKALLFNRLKTVPIF